MICQRRRLALFSMLLIAGLSGARTAGAAVDNANDSPVFRGRPLAFWVAQANAKNGPADLDETVAALSEAVRDPSPSIKEKAADAIATLGPRAKAAIPSLLAQLGHEHPWVRVACQAALGSMGKEAVEALTDTVNDKTGGPRIRAAFVLGGIGADAKPAIPVLVRVMKEESPVMRERIAGVLNQIDPQRFAAPQPTKKAQFDASGLRRATGGRLESPVTDWPQFHGPRRDSICREHGLLQQWPDNGPALLWKLEGLGMGFSTISIAGKKFFTMGDRGKGDDASQYVLAFDLDTRKELWATRIGPPNSDGPRCTPTVDKDSVYALGTDGDLLCLDVATGAVRWHKNLVSDFDGKMMSVWKFSESPLIDGDRLICTPGGPDATLVALDKSTGRLIWKCAIPAFGEKGVDGAAYSSVTVAEICGVRQYVQLLGRGVVGVQADTGRFLWGYNAIANTVANITNPVTRGDYVFATTAYHTGAVLLKISRDQDAFRAQEVYFIPPKDFQNHHGGVVSVGDYIYAGHGPSRGDPTCIDFRTGKIVWKQKAPARGSAAVLYADGHVIFRYDRGDVVLMKASPDGCQIDGRFQAVQDEGPAWAHPVIHDGRLYLRHANILACYDLRQAATQ